MQVFGLIGYPLSHSFSKKYFDNKILEENINHVEFQNFEIPTIANIELMLQQNPALQGFAVTIPYKQQIISYLDWMSDDVKQMSACNCVKIKNGKLYGFNTDVIGFEKSFIQLLQPHHKKALVLGTGGAAQAVLFTLKKIGISFLSVSRNKTTNTITYEALNEPILNEYTIIINTTPLGTYPNTSECPRLPYQYISQNHYLFDLVYNPPQTQFLLNGMNQGAITKNGYDMLTIQAEENWKIWNDVI